MASDLATPGSASRAVVEGVAVLRSKSALAIGRQHKHRSDWPVMADPPMISFGENGANAFSPAISTRNFQFESVAANGKTVTLADQAATIWKATVNIHRAHAYQFVGGDGRAYFRSVIGHRTTQTASPNQWGFSFGYHGAKCAVWLTGAGIVRIKVNGEYVSLTPETVPSSWAGLMFIDFTDAGGGGVSEHRD